MKCTDLLRQDHKIILRCLNVLQSMVERENGERIDQDDAVTLLRFLRTFADEHHHHKEEGVLFPEVVRTSEAQGAPLRHLLFEHGQERSLVGGLESALHTGDRNYCWAELMKPTWALDVLECPRCQGRRMRILAAIPPPETTRKILECLGLPSRAPPVAPPKREHHIQIWF